MIEVQNLKFIYPNGKEVLKGINLTIKDGEFLAIMGENGAGKTTLIKHFNGLLKPTSGKVLVDGIDTRNASIAALSRKVGLVFQNPDHQLFSETVKDEIAFSLRNFGFPKEIIEKRVESILRTLDLIDYTNSSPFMLSGGEKKRVALASVLAWDPKHIILDEPTIGQDYRQKEILRNFILQLNSQGKTVIIVSHDIEFVAECKPRVVLLSNGKIIGDSSAVEIFSNIELIEKASLLPPQISLLMSSLSDLGIPKDVIDVYAAKKVLIEFFKRFKKCH
ncbi:MAG: ABC transporter ATP-binding protein [Candidatus Bathyarchaeia archaeon]